MEKIIKPAASTVAALLVGVLIYHPSLPIGKTYWSTAEHHNMPGFNAVKPMSLAITAGMLFCMATMLAELQRIDHVGFDQAFASDYKLGYLGLSTRVGAIITVLLLPHVLMESRCPKLFLIDRLYDFLAITTMCLVFRQLKAKCDARRMARQAQK